MGSASGGQPAALEPRTYRFCGVGGPASRPLPAHPVPRGRSSRWEPATFLPKGPKPSPVGRRARRGGGAPGGEGEGGKLFSAPRPVAQVFAPGRGGPAAGAEAVGRDPSRRLALHGPRHLGAEPAGREGRLAGMGGGDAAGGRRGCLLGARRAPGAAGGSGQARDRAAGGRGGRRGPRSPWRGAALTLCCSSGGSGRGAEGGLSRRGQPSRGHLRLPQAGAPPRRRSRSLPHPNSLPVGPPLRGRGRRRHSGGRSLHGSGWDGGGVRFYLE